VASFITAILTVLIGVSVLALVGIDISQLPVLGTGVSIVLQGAGFGIAVLLFMKVTDNWALIGARIPSWRDLGWMAGGLVGLMAGYAAIAIVVSLIGVETAENGIVTAGQQNPELVPLLIPLAILVVGPSEELLFRGAIQGLLRRSFSAAPAILIASVLFGTAHVFALLGGGLEGILVYISVTIVLGAILGIIYEYTNNIVVPSLVHGIYNAILFTALYVQVA
jgi:membrane protease YdiL (CAAX protease family)